MATDHEISHGLTIAWTLRATQAPEHILEAWIGTSWIVEVMATLRTAALNLLRLAGFQSIRSGMQARCRTSRHF